jgi:hypothetical protein
MILVAFAIAGNVFGTGLGVDRGFRPHEGNAGGDVDENTPVITEVDGFYSKPVTCTGSQLVKLTVTGEPDTVVWETDPAETDGSCTESGGVWNCTVTATPTASGDGVQTATFTATNDFGFDIVTLDIGFYVTGSHSCFLSQNINGNNNVGLSDSDPVSEWVNLGSSGIDILQGTSANQPSFATNVVNGSPAVEFDGNDLILDTTPSNWSFLTDGTGFVVSLTYLQNIGDNLAIVSTTKTICWSGDSTNYGYCFGNDNRSSVSRINRCQYNFVGYYFIPGYFYLYMDSDESCEDNVFINNTMRYTGSDTVEGRVYVYTNGSLRGNQGYHGLDAIGSTGALSVGGPASASGAFLVGYVFSHLFYSVDLTDTQRGINDQVDEWVLGGELPVTP